MSGIGNGLVGGIGNDPTGRKNIGTLDDGIDVPYIRGESTILGHLNTAYDHIHGPFIVYPDHADSVTLTAGAGIWNTGGAIIEVIPAATLTAGPFDLHWLNIGGISANGEIQVDIFKGGIGSEVRIGAAKTHRNAVQSQEGSKRIQIPQMIAGERISCKLSDSTAGQITCDVSFEGHYYT